MAKKKTKVVMNMMGGLHANGSPVARVIQNNQGQLTQEPRRLPVNLSRANTLSGGSFRTRTGPLSDKPA